jgi:serine/threonine protein kinase
MEKFGQYILLEKVAAGGMAELFKAKKIGIEGFERILAIKRILPHISSDEEFIDMFIAEAKLVAQLSHKNIAQIYDFGKTGSNYFIAMEYVKGKDLRSLLKRCQERSVSMPANLAIFIAREILSALGYAHKQKDSMGKDLKLIHRDVSPQNILISYEGEVKVIDFGIAKAESHSHTKTGTIKGKISYMSPEQAWGKSIDHRSDIFSLGIVLYEMITGKRLFKGETEINTLEKVREAKVEPFSPSLIAITPSELESVVLKALAKEVKDRYQDASLMETDLGKILFALSSTEPASDLKKFMGDLFCAEIEAECKTEIEGATKSVQIDRKAVAVPKERARARPQERQERIQSRPEPRRRIFPYILLASAVVAALIAVFVIWPHTIGENRYINFISESMQNQDEQTEVNTGAKEELPVVLPEQAADINEQAEPSPQEITQEPVVKKPPPPVAKGNLTVNAIPWADIYVNGKHYGTTPKTIKALKTGQHKVKLENPNFEVWTTNVQIAEGKTAKVSHRFEGFGKIIVNAVPWGNVYLDGSLKGPTPITLQRVSARPHQLRISREGFNDVRKQVTVKAGESESISVKLQRKGAQ